MTGTSTRPAVGAALTARRGPREGHRRGALRGRAPRRGRRLRLRSCSRRSPAARSRAVDAGAALALARRARRRSGTRTRRALADRRRPRAAPSCSRTDVAYRGQIVAVVVAESLEAARAGGRARARRLRRRSRTTSSCAPTTPGSTRPRRSTRPSPTDTEPATSRPALAAAAVDASTRRTPRRRSTTTRWSRTPRSRCGDGGDLTLYDSTQGAHDGARRARRGVRARARARPRDRAARRRRLRLQGHAAARTRCSPRWPPAHVERPVKLALTRQQMFASSATARRRSSASGSAPTRDGRLTAIAHDVVEQTLDAAASSPSRPPSPTRMMYAAPQPPHHATGWSALDVPTPSWMRAPGRAPGHVRAGVARWTSSPSRCGIDPIELRIRNEPDVDPESGLPFAQPQPRRLPARGRRALRLGGRDPRPGVRREGRWLVGTGVAASTYPRPAPAVAAPSRAPSPTARFVVRIGAADIGTGARTVLTQIAADALGVARRAASASRSATAPCPRAMLAGGSMGTASWGSAVVKACARAARAPRRARAARCPPTASRSRRHRRGRRAPTSASRGTPSARSSPRSASTPTPARSASPRLLGVFAAGRILNPRPPARSSSAA